MIFNPYLPPSGEQIRYWSKEAERRIAAGEPLDGIPFAVIGTVDDRQFGHNTVDLTLGRYINQPVQGRTGVRGGYTTVDLHDGPHHMVPGNFCLPITNEIIYCGMWPQLCIGWQAQVSDTSTHARRGGSSHAHAGYVDVGFYNHLTLEERPALPLALRLGMVTCQIAFQPVNLGTVYPVQGNIYQERTGIAPIPKAHKIYLPK
jgi:deoxycytidine triphosphate deaminase